MGDAGAGGRVPVPRGAADESRHAGNVAERLLGACAFFFFTAPSVLIGAAVTGLGVQCARADSQVADYGLACARDRAACQYVPSGNTMFMLVFIMRWYDYS